MIDGRASGALSRLFAGILVLAAFAGPCFADETAEDKAFKEQMRQMQQQMDELRHEIQGLRKQQAAAAPSGAAAGSVPGTVAGVPAPTPKAGKEASSEPLFEKFLKGFYGTLDVSFDDTTKGINGLTAYNYSLVDPTNPNSGYVQGPAKGVQQIGRLGYMPALSTNKSQIGYRNSHEIGSSDVDFIIQVETQLALTSSPGLKTTYTQQSNVVSGAIGLGDTFVGLQDNTWGKVKFGTTYAPYKKSTDPMNPFSGMLGDYAVIMGNSGGDNRVEFGTRLDHSIWYESPNWRGLVLNALYSPGQNRASNSDNIASGESDCTGGNVPGSGGITPVTCSDGSFSDAVSASLSYTHGPLFLTAAYERHMKVNRSSDITGIYGSGNAASVVLAAQDVADEDAAKIGIQYSLPNKATLSGILESLHRYVPSDLEFQNERQRMGTWFVFSQPLSRVTSIHLGWAHAFRTPGDPGQHNDSFETPPGGVPGTDTTAGAHANNTANLFTTALKYRLSDNLSVYTNWAFTANGPAAHYDLGAGGRAVTTDCHDASDATGGLVASNPHCWTGGRLMGTSLGMVWKF